MTSAVPLFFARFRAHSDAVTSLLCYGSNRLHLLSKQRFYCSHSTAISSVRICLSRTDRQLSGWMLWIEYLSVSLCLMYSTINSIHCQWQLKYKIVIKAADLEINRKACSDFDKKNIVWQWKYIDWVKIMCYNIHWKIYYLLMETNNKSGWHLFLVGA